MFGYTEEQQVEHVVVKIRVVLAASSVIRAKVYLAYHRLDTNLRTWENSRIHVIISENDGDPLRRDLSPPAEAIEGVRPRVGTSPDGLGRIKG